MAYDGENKNLLRLSLTPEEEKARELFYNYLTTMIELKDKKMPHFSGPEGERSWNEMVDDSEKILNGYTLSRSEQGKEDWQANTMDNIARAKMRAIAAGVGLKTPEMAFAATNQEGVPSPYRAEVFKTIVKNTFEQGNPALHAFQEVWHMLSHGIIVEYEGFQTGGAKREKIVSFNTRTGEIETKSEYIPGIGKPFSAILNPQEFFWWTFQKRDIQAQPRIAWVQHYTKAEVTREFEQYKNFKFILDKKQAAAILPLSDSTFFENWSERVDEENDYEVARIYSKEDNLDDDSPCYGYEVWVNGIPMLRAPLLWGEEDPQYPFAKQIAEPYANTEFFVGMPFGQIVEAYQETKNTVLNTMIDKLYRSMKPPYLVGLQNKDLLDFEGQFVDEDNRFYVPDVNQVKPFPYNSLNSGEFNMLAVLDKGIESLSVDRAQQGQASGNGKTAREVLIANTRAEEMKGILFLALEDLWYQKTTLRVQTVVTHYLLDKATQTYTKDQMITVPNYTFGDGTRGNLVIHIAKNENSRLSPVEVNGRALAQEAQGQPTKVVSITADYVDGWKLDFKIVPQSMRDKDKLEEGQELDAEVQWVSTLYPEFFVANKDKYLTEKLALRGKHLSDYNPPAPPQPAANPQQPSPNGQPTAQDLLTAPQDQNILGLPQS